MAQANQKFFSIVLLGRPNPQILNHDFLVANDILPHLKPFFKEVKESETPYTEFFSTPPVSRIAYEEFSIQIQEDRFQAMDTSGGDPQTSPIIGITKRLYGDILKYTPFTRGGLNLNYEIFLENDQERNTLDAKMGIDMSQARIAFDTDNPSISITATFPFNNGRILISMAKPRDTYPLNCNFNMDFDFNQNLNDFLMHIDEISRLLDYTKNFYLRMGVKL